MGFGDPLSFLRHTLPFSPAPITTADLPKLIEVGDSIRIKTTEGKVRTFRVQAVEQTSFLGVSANEKIYRVPYREIATVLVRRKGERSFRDPRAP